MTPQEFARAQIATPRRPGECVRMVDDWIAHRTGRSPLARYGRDFTTDEDVEQWLAEPGSLAVAVNRGMRALGFKRTKEPREGDVGLVVINAILYGAINIGQGWFTRGPNGFVFAPATKLWRAWRIE